MVLEVGGDEMPGARTIRNALNVILGNGWARWGGGGVSKIIGNSKNVMHFHCLEVGEEVAAGSRIIKNHRMYAFS